jgi:hypothetical protein
MRAWFARHAAEVKKKAGVAGLPHSSAFIQRLP